MINIQPLGGILKNRHATPETPQPWLLGPKMSQCQLILYSWRWHYIPGNLLARTGNECEKLCFGCEIIKLVSGCPKPTGGWSATVT